MAQPIRSAAVSRADAGDDAFEASARRRRYLVGLGALLGGAANVVMQLSNPPVGRGVYESTVESGRYDLHPRKRGRTTLTYLAVAMLGTQEDRLAYRAATNTSHRTVKSAPDSEIRYNAFDPELQLWVAACIYQGVRDCQVLFFGELDEATEDDLYRESARFGTTLQMGQDLWPVDRAAFAQYWNGKLHEISVDPEVKRYLLDQVVNLGPYERKYRIALGPAHRFFTTGFLPQRFRDELGLPWSPRRQQVFEILLRALGLILARLPQRYRLYPYENYLRDMRRRRALGKPLV
nr:oxygenase MpaB family protein [Nocardia acidivorans]